MKSLLPLVCLLLVVVPLLHAFNLDVSPWIFNGSKDAYFGYQVALHRVDKTVTKLVVTAPRATLPGVAIKEGALYTCAPDGFNNTCLLQENLEEKENKDLYQKNDQWQGMSLTSITDFTYTCAPLWHQNRSRTGRPSNVWYRGRCSMLNNDFSNTDYTFGPCEDKRGGNLQYGYCAAGFSSTGFLSYTNYPVFITGAPGARNFKGLIYAMAQGHAGGPFSKPITFSSTEDRITDLSALMGYAVSWGNFTRNMLGDVAGGAPRAANLKGKVIMYTIDGVNKRFSIETTIESPDQQVGAYFGSAVCAVDLNNDKLDDLLVGSPMYSTVREEGRIYIYMNKPGPKFGGFDPQTFVLEGDLQLASRFGSTISNIGDVNNDNFNDIVVGAPGGGSDGKGAIYIYNGGSNGIRPKYSQRIFASTYKLTLGGFGNSLAGGVDMDENQYPDVAVGAFLDGKAFIFRTRPVLTLSDILSTDTDTVNQRVKNCTFVAVQYNCINLTVNLEYSGKGSPDRFDLELTVDLDKQKPINKRVFILDNANQMVHKLSQNVTVKKMGGLQVTYQLYITVSGDFDVLAPILLSTSYKAYDDKKSCASKPCPIIDIYSMTTSTKRLNYLIDCGGDRECKTDLSVKTNLQLPNVVDQSVILYGKVYQVNLNADVINFGEPAYQSNMKLNFTSDLQVIGVLINGRSYPLWKQRIIDKHINELSFPLANPINLNQTVKVVAKFSINKLRPTYEQYTFSTEVTSLGSDVNLANNKASNSILTKVETCLEVSGSVLPVSVIFLKNAKQPPSVNASVAHIGPEVNYTFFIQNSGKLPVSQLIADVDIVVTNNKIDLLYVVDITVDGIQCDASQVNAKKYLLETPVVAGNSRKRRSNTEINCRTGDCKTYRCRINRLNENKGVVLLIVTRVHTANLVQMNAAASDIETKIDIKFDGPDKDQNVPMKDCLMKHSVKLTVRPEELTSPSKKVEWWYILLAVLGAVILLTLAVVILYRVGFFKRNRKIKDISQPEQEPTKSPIDFEEDDDA